MGKVCTVNMTVLDESLGKLEVEFLIDGKWVAAFHGGFEADSGIEYKSDKPKFTWMAR